MVAFPARYFSPDLQCRARIVYCRNPPRSIWPRLRELLWECKFLLFSVLPVSVPSTFTPMTWSSAGKSGFAKLFSECMVCVGSLWLTRSLTGYCRNKEGILLGSRAFSFYPALPRVFRTLMCYARRLIFFNSG